MQGLLASLASDAAPAPAQPHPLSLANLAHHTAQHPPAPRRTVQSYLAATPASPRAYADPPLSPQRVRAEFEGVSTPPRFRAWRDAQREGAGPQRATEEEALVLHASVEGQKEGAHRDEQPPRRRKPLLVQAMRGRTSSAAAAAAPAKNADKGKGRARDEERDVSGESSILVPRIERQLAAAGGEGAGAGAQKYVNVKARGKEKVPKGGKLRAEAEEDDELDEVEERLRARRERRRANAVIRKDRTLSAAAVGAAAAYKVKAARRRDEGSDEEQENEDAGRKKAKRATKEGESRRRVQEMGRAKNVATGRLTLKPKPQLGIFNKGKASARTKVGKGLPDLAFSEHAFLHGAPSPPSSSSSSGSSASSLPAPANALPPGRAKRTYGSKPAQRTSLGRRASGSGADAGWIEAASPAAPTPAAVSKTGSSSAGKGRLRFSHVEVPLLQPRPRSRLSGVSGGAGGAGARRPLQELRASGEGEGTESGALSAASLARRGRARNADAREEEGQEGTAETEGMGTDEIERVLQEVESVRTCSTEEEEAEGVYVRADEDDSHCEAADRGGADGAAYDLYNAAPIEVAGSALDNDGAPFVPPFAPSSAVDNTGLFNAFSAFDDGDAPVGPGPHTAVGADTPFLPSSPVFAHPLSADVFEDAALVRSPSPASAYPSTCLASPPFRQLPLLHISLATAPAPAGVQDALADDGAFRAAMRRQWPRTRP
ncbi:hypothetical protein JCM10450v2_004142 [Rhodotorula kratochvilovae]